MFVRERSTACHGTLLGLVIACEGGIEGQSPASRSKARIFFLSSVVCHRPQKAQILAPDVDAHTESHRSFNFVVSLIPCFAKIECLVLVLFFYCSRSSRSLVPTLAPRTNRVNQRAQGNAF